MLVAGSAHVVVLQSMADDFYALFGASVAMSLLSIAFCMVVAGEYSRVAARVCLSVPGTHPMPCSEARNGEGDCIGGAAGTCAC